jgi:hypothetical protein
MDKTVLHLICNQSWMISELSLSENTIVKHSYGLDIPVHSINDAWWIPQGIANRFIHSGVIFTPQAPGSNWLPSQPKELVKRNVESITVKDIKEKISSPLLMRAINGEKLFWKFAEAKVDTFMGEARDFNDVLTYIDDYDIPDDSVMQVSEVLDVQNEYRFFIVNNEVKACSPYLNRIHGVELTYYDSSYINTEEFEAVQAYVRSIAHRLNSPSAYVLDVASLPNGEFVVLEANPAWCSAWYGADIDGVVETIVASWLPSESFTYIPDMLLTKTYSKMSRINFGKRL